MPDRLRITVALIGQMPMMSGTPWEHQHSISQHIVASLLLMKAVQFSIDISGENLQFTSLYLNFVIFKFNIRFFFHLRASDFIFNLMPMPTKFPSQWLYGM